VSDPQFRTRLKVMWDYGAFPIWQDGGIGAGVRPAGPDSPRTPAPTAAEIDAHNDAGRRLTERVREALGAKYEVVFWAEE
jgi:hypothetical protein